MRTIPQRELRNDVARVLRAVEAGEVLQVTVNGRPVAQIVPVGGARRSFVARDEIIRILGSSALDPSFGRDVDAVLAATIDEL